MIINWIPIDVLKMDNFEEAEYNFEEAYFLAPDDKEALLGLAKALEQAERWNPVIRKRKRARGT